MTGAEYQAALEKLIPAVRAVDPSVKLVAVHSDATFDQPWINSDFTPFISSASVHIGYSNSDSGGSPASAAAATTQAKLPDTSVLPQLASARALLDGGPGNGAHVRVSIDEWGLGPPWVVENFNAAHALYGASFMTMALTNAENFGVSYTNYFEPINEGAIEVLQFSALPTPLGVVLPLFGALAGSTRLAVEQLAPGSDDDVAGIAGLVHATDATSSILVCLTNRNATAGFTQALHIDGVSLAATASVRLLAATGFSTGSAFVDQTFAIAVSADGWAEVPLPAFSVAAVTVECLSC